MSALLKLLSKHLSPELLSSVQEELGDDFDFDYVPRSRLNAVIAQRNELRAQLAELEASGKTSGASDDEGDEGTGTRERQQPDVDIEALKAQHQAELDNLKKRYALAEELRAAKCKNPDLLIDKFDFEKLGFDDKGKLTGHTEAIEAWKTSDPYLFEAAGEDVPPGTGAAGAKGASKQKKPDKVDALLSEVFGFEIKD